MAEASPAAHPGAARPPGHGPADRYAIVFFAILGYFLGPLLENHTRRALIISHGDPTTFVTRPISLVLLSIAAIALILAVLPSIRRKREVVFQEEPV